MMENGARLHALVSEMLPSNMVEPSSTNRHERSESAVTMPFELHKDKPRSHK